ncbi:hypothetical protein USDA257_c23730 [Sinorhizobium fredii USDA 257]|uniref:Uncharacterized protein n=1 Tax=Sinorhizobium fredii (strain USDA 257) TaxID=1185652 RepID=I3X4Z4_SINF2|nr:hypothetical protein USDA257_c23730 [Sinorhizobium fredii USDA 257]
MFGATPLMFFRICEEPDVRQGLHSHHLTVGLSKRPWRVTYLTLS